MSEMVNFRFNGSFAEGLEFVEAENQDGESVGVGEWVKDGDDWLLQVRVEEVESP